MNYTAELFGVVVWCLLLWGIGASVNHVARRPFMNWRAIAGGSLLVIYALEVILISDGRIRNPADVMVTHFLFYVVPGAVLLFRGDKWRHRVRKPAEVTYYDGQRVRLGDRVRLDSGETVEGTVVYLPASSQAFEGYTPPTLAISKQGFIVATDDGDSHHFLDANKHVALLHRAVGA